MTTKLWLVAALILGIATVVASTGYTVSRARDKETAVYSEMHRMINTKIIAEDGQVWGREEITPERCDELIAVVTKGNLKDKETLLGFLARWKLGDFSESASEHNYIWNVLGGTTGKAKPAEALVKEAIDPSETNSFEGVGNSMEALNLGDGLIAEQGDYIYSITGRGRFFRTKVGEKSATRFLVNEMQEGYDYSSLNVIGDWIYYVNESNNALYKVKTDGTNQTKLCDNVRRCIAAQGWIYFISSADHGIYKIKSDGSQKTELVKGTNSFIDYMSIEGDWISFGIIEDNSRPKATAFIKTDGTNLKKLDLLNGFVYQGWIYSQVHDEKSKANHLSRQKIDGGNIEQLTNDSITFQYTVHDNKVYFQKALPSDYYLYELDLDTKAVKGLIKSTSVAGLNYINITDKYIFLSGAAPESAFIDMVRIPIDSKSDKSGEEIFNTGSLKWEPAK